MPSPTLPTPPAGGDEEEDDAAAVFSLVSSPEASSSISSEMPAAYGEDGVEVEPRKGGCEDGGEEEDLICRRTRARYSLANFTLDELETFLQETDDEEDFQKADDEEEYQKFLAGVLAGEGEYEAAGKEAEDEDEDENDADFEVELEELLESDHEEDGKGEEEGNNVGAKGCNGRDRRRPDTRQNRCRRSLGRPREKPLGQAVIPLRPILPSWVPAPSLVPGIVAKQGRCGGLGLASQPIVVSSFTPHQIGQLHCLIHEHAQLLIQIYTLCAFEPSKQSVASDVKRLILELNGFRNEALSRRTIPYPADSFRPPHIHPSVVREAPNNTFVAAEQVPPIWVPLVGSSITSVTDVAPLGCVGRYLSDVGNGRC